MRSNFRIAVAQLNPHEGQIEANLRALRAARAEAARAGADLLVTPEFSIAGYPPEDLVLRPGFVADCRGAIAALAADTGTGPAMLVGGPAPAADGGIGNAAFLLDGGRVETVQAKHALPNYGVFDDKRYFAPGPVPGPVLVRGVSIGLCVCEDWWTPCVPGALAVAGAEILLSINGSPFEDGKSTHRMELAGARVRETGLPFVFCGQVGGQDELVFDGASFVMTAEGRVAAAAPAFEEALLITDWRRGGTGWRCDDGDVPPAPPADLLVYRALMLGLADYVRKNGFPSVLLGLSGGIDSALSAAIAVDALGAELVSAVMLPSPYTSAESLEDAEASARSLGIRLDTISIEPAMRAFEAMLAPAFAARAPDVTEENIQSRARGLVLMALSNKTGAMLLTTGNKSEMSTGYATLYGDMCGGYSVLKDVYKTRVFALARARNAARPAGALGPAGAVMPERVILKPPSAELRPDQKDEDSLPPYAILDGILERLVEGAQSVDEVVRDGFDRATVVRVWRMLDRAEYKRRQAPPGVKISVRAFGRDRRYPITNGYTELVR